MHYAFHANTCMPKMHLCWRVRNSIAVSYFERISIALALTKCNRYAVDNVFVCQWMTGYKHKYPERTNAHARMACITTATTTTTSNKSRKSEKRIEINTLFPAIIVSCRHMDADSWLFILLFNFNTLIRKWSLFIRWKNWKNKLSI